MPRPVVERAPSIRILLVEDDEDLLGQAQAALKSLDDALQITTASNGEEALKRVEEELPDIVISDISMPIVDGLTLCRKLKQNIFYNRVPIILLTSRAQIDDRISGFEAGADDYLVKPIDYRELMARIKAIIRRYKVIMDLNPSTRLPGPDAVEEEIFDRIKKKEKFSIAYVDLDNFKAYADTYGFQNANKAIKLTARIVSETLKSLKIKDSFLAHIGGDDFIVLAPTRQTAKIGRKVVDAFRERIRSCFSNKDLENDYFLGYDRDGNYCRFPIMTLSVVLMMDAGTTFRSAREIGEEAAKAKRLAKRRGGCKIVTLKQGVQTHVEVIGEEEATEAASRPSRRSTDSDDGPEDEG